jgi:subtilisin family serine protease
LIEVEFVEDARSGVETWDFDKDEPRSDLSKDWTPELREILQRAGLVSWKPSFPLRYPWSRECSKSSALESYFEERRHKFVTFKFPQGTDVVRIAKKLTELPEIDQAVSVPQIGPPCHALAEHYTVNSDPAETAGYPEYLTKQWYLVRCDVPGAWAEQASGKGVVIADIDWGFDLTHPDLLRTELSKNVITNSPNVSDGNLLHHGNGVLGLAGAAVSEGGMAGIAFEATLWAIQAGTGVINRPVVEPDFWVGAINFVRTTPAAGRKVIILEVQTLDFSNIEMVPSIRKEIIEAIRDQIVVCVPAGNGNRSYDAGLDDHGVVIPDSGSIVVGATRFDPDINPASGTNEGSRVVVYAPGDPENDLTCGSTPTRYRYRFGGTSGATAKVAGVVALMLEKNDQLTPCEIREILGQSQKYVVDQGRTVGVLLDANQAVGEAIYRRSTADGETSTTQMNGGELALQPLRSVTKTASV